MAKKLSFLGLRMLSRAHISSHSAMKVLKPQELFIDKHAFYPKLIRISSSSFTSQPYHSKPIFMNSISNKAKKGILQQRPLMNLVLARQLHFGKKILSLSPKAKILSGLGATSLFMFLFPVPLFTLLFGTLGFLAFKLYRSVNFLKDLDHLFKGAGFGSKMTHWKLQTNQNMRQDDMFFTSRPSIFDYPFGFSMPMLSLFDPISKNLEAHLYDLQSSALHSIQQHIKNHTLEGLRIQSLMSNKSFREYSVERLQYSVVSSSNDRVELDIKFNIPCRQGDMVVHAQGYAVESRGKNTEVTLTSLYVSLPKTNERLLIPLKISPMATHGPIREAEYREL